MQREEIKIKDCFWLKDGKCTDPEIDRFRYPEVAMAISEGKMKQDACPYPPNDTAFLPKGQVRNVGYPNHLRCLEFREE